ncbi:MAG: GAF domain-containing protein [Actinomycetes bacterium]
MSEAVAETLMELLGARSCNVTLLDAQGYLDLVNVGVRAPGALRFPDNDRYLTSQFPLSTQMLREAGGYLSTTNSSAVFKEYQGVWPTMPAGSLLGVPIFAGGEVRGELLLARDAGAPAFTTEDLDMARDLATQYGAVLPGLIGQETPKNR